MPERTALRVRSDHFNDLCNKHGWTRGNQRAAALGVSPATISRVKSGGVASAKFIDACVRAFGADSYHRLFCRTEVSA